MSQKKQENKSIYDLELHEHTQLPDGTQIMRVPGGWRYDVWDYCEAEPKAGVFVAYNDEFQKEFKIVGHDNRNITMYSSDQIPVPWKENKIDSVTVIMVDEDNCVRAGFYNYANKYWYVFDDSDLQDRYNSSQTKFRWYYAPINKFRND